MTNKKNFAPREERKRPIEDDELRGLESLKPWELMPEEEYETSIIAEYNADEV